jgi:hypothetical protein
MSKTDKTEAILQFKKIIKYLKETESIGLDIKRVEELTVIDYKSRGYSKPAKVRNAKKAHFEKLDFKRAQIEAIIPLYENIVKELEMKDEPERSIKAILKKLAPYGSWAALAYTILHNCGVI